MREASPLDTSGDAGEILSGDVGSGDEGGVRPGLPRVVDAVLAALGLVLSSPVLLAASVSVAMTSGLPVFFRQRRIGRGGRPFTLVKLRTMRASRGGPNVTAGDDDRVTPVGRFLRRSKLDELPELWNVMKGDMALVGPRPEVPEFVDPADPMWKTILLARPGLTDPVTVSLRDEELLMARIAGDRERYYRETLQPQKLRGYVSYLSSRSWWRDLEVIGVTTLAILRPGRGRPDRLSRGPGSSNSG